jgi:D-sedoheptulose 7-phosphate isomerase
MNKMAVKEKDWVITYLAETRNVTREILPGKIVDGMKLLQEARRIWIIGNGGSASLAEHFAQDLRKMNGLKASALMNISEITAIGNDLGYKRVFSNQIATLAKPEDLVVAISGSGNSPNILNGLWMAKKIGCKTLGITGMDGGRMGKPYLQYKRGKKIPILLDVEINVPSMSMAHSEDGHLMVTHLLVYGLKEIQ